MGVFASKMNKIFWEMANGPEPLRILMLGLDAAGKTTMLYKFKVKGNVTTTPTIGFNVETIHPCDGLSLTIWDVGGQYKIRQLWNHYFYGVQGLLYVVDSSDVDRLHESYEELRGVLLSPELSQIPFVVFANKQDLPGALSSKDLAHRMKLSSFSDNKWHVQASCATTGKGLKEGIETLAKFIKERRCETQG